MLLAALLATIATCPVEHARYALRTTPTTVATFVKVETGPEWPAGLAFRIDAGQSGRSYWFLPWNGGSDGAQHLASTTDIRAPNWTPPSPDGGPRPLGDLDYIATDASYGVLAAVPRRGQTAPAHILLPTLDDRLRHPLGGQARDSLPRQFFDLIDCHAPPAHLP